MFKRKNHESRTDLYNRVRAQLVEEAKTQHLGGPAHQKIKEIDAIQNAPTLYSEVGKVVKKVLRKKPKVQPAKPTPTAVRTPVKSAVKDPGKPVDEKRTPTEPIDVIGSNPVEPLPLHSQLK